VVLKELDEVRTLSESITLQEAPVRVVIAPYIPSQVVSALASEGVASFEASANTVASLGKQKQLSLPKASTWGDATDATAGRNKVRLKWLAIDREQKWTHAGRSSSVR